jgi:hypothetical protein
MKKLKNIWTRKYAASLIAIPLALWGLIALNAATTKPVTFIWTPPPTNGTPMSVPDIYKLYYTTNVGQPLTNWVVLAVIPGDQTNYHTAMVPGAYFFTMTASNFWGESPFSNLAGTPPALDQGGSGFGVKPGN